MIKLHPERSKPVLLYVFESALRLLHPFMPFITEELWQNIPHEGESIVIAEYPEFDPALADAAGGVADGDDSGHHREGSEHPFGDECRPEASRCCPDGNGGSRRSRSFLTDAREYIFKLAPVSQLEIVPQLQGDKLAAQAVAAGCALEVPLDGLIDQDAERARLERELRESAEGDRQPRAQAFQCQLCGASAAEVVEENRRRLADYQDQAAKLKSALERLT